MNRDPIGEEGGCNLYSFLENKTVKRYDLYGLTSPELGVYAAFSITASAAGKPHMSFTLVGSARQELCSNIKINADIGLRVLSGGLGTSLGAQKTSFEFFTSVSGSVGYSNGEETPFAINGSQWISAIPDTFGESLSWGQAVYYNSAYYKTKHEIPRFGFLRIRSGDFFVNYQNDIKSLPTLGDGGDRGWTGGGMIGFNVLGNMSAFVAFDAFTGAWNSFIDREIVNGREVYKQEKNSKSLNQAWWSLGIINSSGGKTSLSLSSTDQANLQHWIHGSSLAPTSAEFSYPQGFQFHLQFSGESFSKWSR